MDAGYLTEALAAYKADLGRGVCAIRGIAAVKAEIAKQATDPPAVQQAKKAAAKKFAAAIVVIRRLQAEGFESKARAKTQALVEAYPDRALPADIRAIDQPIDWWRRQEGNGGPLLVSVAEMAIVALGALVVVLVVIKGLFALARRTPKRYTVGAVTGPVPEDVAGQDAVLAAELAEIATNGRNHIRRVPAAGGDFSLPEAVTTAYPQAAVIAGLLQVLDRMLPRRLLTVSAAVWPADATRGVGVTVTIAKRGGHEVKDGSCTISESDFGPVAAEGKVPQRIERLMLPAAVWVGYHPALAVFNVVKSGGRRDRTRVLGTNEWRSYAHFALSAREQTAGNIDTARRGYFKALDNSDTNIGARINLAGLFLYSSDKPEKEKAADRASRLSFAWWLLEDALMRREMRDAAFRLRARWLYLRAARDLTDDFPIDPPDGTDMLPPALGPKGAADEARAVARTHHGPDALPDPMAELWNGVRDPRHDATGLAAEMQAPANVLMRCIQLEQRKAADPNAAVEDLIPEHEAWFKAAWWTADTLYNLACFRARYARHLPDGDEKTTMIADACSALCTAVDRAPDPNLMLAMADRDPTLRHVSPAITEERRNKLTGYTAPTYEHRRAGRPRARRQDARGAVGVPRRPRDPPVATAQFCPVYVSCRGRARAPADR